MTTDDYLGRRFDAESYTCLHFARDVWLDLTGEDLSSRLGTLLAAAGRSVRKSSVRSFRRLVAPADPCLVLMQRPHGEPHIGVYFQRRVLHLHEGGAEYQPVEVASRGFRTVRYFLPC